MIIRANVSSISVGHSGTYKCMASNVEGHVIESDSLDPKLSLESKIGCSKCNFNKHTDIQTEKSY